MTTQTNKESFVRNNFNSNKPLKAGKKSDVINTMGDKSTIIIVLHASKSLSMTKISRVRFYIKLTMKHAYFPNSYIN